MHEHDSWRAKISVLLVFMFACEEFGDLPGTREANGTIVYSFTVN